MRCLKRVQFIALAIIFISCRPEPSKVEPSQPKEIHADGAYKHKGFGMVFPGKVGKFKRGGVTQCTPNENDVAIDYESGDQSSPIVVTVYVYPAAESASAGSTPDPVKSEKNKLFQEHLNDVKLGISLIYPEAKLTSEADFTLNAGGEAHKGRKIIHELAYNYGGAKPQDSISETYLFQKGEWLIKYRITFPKSVAVQSEAAVADFLGKLEWPKKE